MAGRYTQELGRDWKEYLEDLWNDKEPPDINKKMWKWLKLIPKTNENAIWLEDNLDEVLFGKEEMLEMADSEKEQKAYKQLTYRLKI